MTMTSLEWLRARRSEPCPTCSGHPPRPSLVQTTAWCPRCHRVWRFNRDISKKPPNPGRHWYPEYVDRLMPTTRAVNNDRSTEEPSDA